MSRHAQLPPSAADYLRHLEQCLAAHSASQREEILEDVAGHVQARLEKGQPLSEVLARLGDPEAIAAATDDSATTPGADRAGRRNRIAEVAQAIAIALAAAAALAVITIPGAVVVTRTSGGNQIVRHETLLEQQGPLFLLVLLIPVLLAGYPLLFSHPARRVASLASAIVFTVAAVLASASIGWFFLPAVLAAWLAAIILLTHHRKGTS